MCGGPEVCFIPEAQEAREQAKCGVKMELDRILSLPLTGAVWLWGHHICWVLPLALASQGRHGVKLEKTCKAFIMVPGLVLGEFSLLFFVSLCM